MFIPHYTLVRHIYSIWHTLLDRVYNCTDDCNKTYKEVTICKEWLYFPFFLNWYLNQPNYTTEVAEILEIEGTYFEIDKDLLSKNIKEYNPLSCCLVPKSLNNTLAIGNNRGLYPLGISKSKSVKNDKVYIDFKGRANGCQVAQITSENANDSIDVNYYRSIAKQFKNIDKIPEDEWAAVGYCFLAYKRVKEADMKKIANYWYNYPYNGHIVHVITKECYDALMNWTVDIND